MLSELTSQGGRILLGGLAAPFCDALVGRLEVSFERHERGLDLLASVRQGPVAAVVLDHLLDDPPALDLLRVLAEEEGARTIPVVYLLDRGLRAELGERLVGDLGVRRLLFQPPDEEELLHAVAEVAGLPRPKETMDQRRERARLVMAEIWARTNDRVMGQVGVLERAATALSSGSLEDGLRLEARAEAHKLAGTVGSFGFGDASALARELEHLLSGGSFDESAALRISELVLSLRVDLSRPFDSGEPALGRGGSPVLAVLDDPVMAAEIAGEAAARAMRTQTVASLEEARELLTDDPPALAMLSLSLSGNEKQECLDFLGELAAADVPTLVFTTSSDTIDRVEVVRRGGRGFLDLSLPADRIVDSAAQLLAGRGPGRYHVLAIDDEPAVLAVLRELLESEGLRITTLTDPMEFWDALELAQPDLIMLDIDMPYISGIELCRALRGDPRWSTIPVLFLTGHQDPRVVRRVFSAGADDYLAKPIAGPEVISRIANRLERVQLFKELAETDPLTGVANRRKSSEVVNGYLKLAARYGQPLSIALIDLDGFKSINDTHGHGVGDGVLRRLGGHLTGFFRGEDVVGRWGGEEFLIGMYGMERDDGVRRLSEALRLFAEIDFEGEEGPFNVAFSGGVAQCELDGMDLPSLYRSADDALYRSKQQGRSRVLAAGSGVGAQRVDVVMVVAEGAVSGHVKKALEVRGYEVMHLRNGEEAVRRLCEPEGVTGRVIVLDVDLPGQDGLAVLARLKDSGVTSTSSTILLTERLKGKEAIKATERDEIDLVFKPVSVPVLMQRVRKALGE